MPTSSKEVLESLHSLFSNSNVLSSCNTVHTPLDLAKLRHIRMGHLFDNVLHTLSNKIPFPFHARSDSDLCTICLPVKQKRLPFVPHNNITDVVFDMIHCDAWGPFS